MDGLGAGGGRNYSFKVVLLGEGCVGKTSVVLRYVENKFNDKHLTTLQVLHSVKNIMLTLHILLTNNDSCIHQLKMSSDI